MLNLGITEILILCFSYLMGSLSTAIIVCRLMGLADPRTLGSKNPGATNVLRIGGKEGKIAAAITLFGDGLKGFIPVITAVFLQLDAIIIALVALLAFLGHLFPVFFAFKGGKGVATAFGVILAINPWVALALLASWLIMAFGLKISSLSAITATLLAPVFFWFLEPQSEFFWMSCVIAIFLIIRHQSNIQKLLRGEESQIKS